MEFTEKEKIILYAAMTKFDRLEHREQAYYIQKALGYEPPSIEAVLGSIEEFDNHNILSKIQQD